MEKQTKCIIGLFKRWKMEIRKTHLDDNIECVCTDFIIAYYNKIDNKMVIMFNVSTKPDESARFTIELSKKKIIKKLIVDDVFIYLNNFDNIITGDKAINIYNEHITKIATQKYIFEQEEIELLNSHEGIPC